MANFNDKPDKPDKPTVRRTFAIVSQEEPPYVLLIAVLIHLRLEETAKTANMTVMWPAKMVEEIRRQLEVVLYFAPPLNSAKPDLRPVTETFTSVTRIPLDGAVILEMPEVAGGPVCAMRLPLLPAVPMRKGERFGARVEVKGGGWEMVKTPEVGEGWKWMTRLQCSVGFELQPLILDVEESPTSTPPSTPSVN